MTKYDEINGGFKNEENDAGDPEIDKGGYYGRDKVQTRQQMNLAIATNLSFDWIKENWEPIIIIIKCLEVEKRKP